MPGPAFYSQRSRQSLEQFGKSRAQSSLAEMGAQRLEALGPQGQEWAQRLRADPRAALAMAQQYGGFQQIEAGLRYAKANANSASAEDLARIGLETGGAEDFQRIGAGAAAVRSTNDLPGDVMTLRKEFGKVSEPFAVQRDFYTKAVAASREARESDDPKDRGSADFALIQAMGKLMDPNSVVRNEEGKLIQEAGSSQVGTWLQQINRLFGQSGITDPRARLNLIRQIQAQYDNARVQQVGRVKRFANELVTDFGFPEQYVGAAIPDNADPTTIDEDGEPISFDIGFWEQTLSGGPVSDDDFISALESAEPGTVMTGPNGRKYRKNPPNSDEPYSRVE